MERTREQLSFKSLQEKQANRLRLVFNALGTEDCLHQEVNRTGRNKAEVALEDSMDLLSQKVTN